jgi:hypothetical protein
VLGGGAQGVEAAAGARSLVALRTALRESVEGDAFRAVVGDAIDVCLVRRLPTLRRRRAPGVVGAAVGGAGPGD